MLCLHLPLASSCYIINILPNNIGKIINSNNTTIKNNNFIMNNSYNICNRILVWYIYTLFYFLVVAD